MAIKIWLEKALGLKFQDLPLSWIKTNGQNLKKIWAPSNQIVDLTIGNLFTVVGKMLKITTNDILIY